MASDQRTRDEKRVRLTTRSLLAGSVAATAAFGGLAAAATTQDSAATPTARVPTTQYDESYDDDFDSGQAVAPQQSFAPPVAQSGGS